VLRVAVATVVLMLVLAFVARPLLGVMLRASRLRYEAVPARRASRSAGVVSIAVTYATVCAGVTQLIGVHEALGAFAAGVTFPRESDMERDEARGAVTRAVLPITFAVLLPSTSSRQVSPSMQGQSAVAV
jgi:Kef-type K+ transport system membrane component KefB